MRKVLMTSAALAALALPAGAADLAMVLANGDYETLSDLRGGTAPAQARAALERAGFTVLAEDDADAGEIRARLARLIADAPKADRIVVALSGHFRHSDRETWFLPVDAETGDFNEAVTRGLPLSAVLTVLARHPGQAVLLLGADAVRDAPRAAGGYLFEGVGSIDIPQGVTVLTGAPAAVGDYLGGDLLRPGTAIDTAAARADLRAAGFLPKGHVLIAAGPATDTTSAAPQARPADDDRAYWDLAQRENTVAAYQLYLERFPRGEQARTARERIAAIEAEPARAAKAAEDGLNLTRDQRREVQQNLTILGYDPKGVDGLFGPASRAAIGRWQAAEGFDPSGFLSREQLTRLAAQGARRAAELEAEAAERRAEQERQDRMYWDETGAAGDEAGLRAYLKKYPDGLFAELATERLGVFESQRRDAAAAEDRAAWDRAARADTVAAYRDYLAGRADPAFREEAETRIAALQNEADGAADLERARAAEDALNLPGLMRTLVETRLAQLDLKPGRADGVFDDDTRRAIRRYQQARNLPVTGYLDQATVAQLLAGGIGLR
ncbi:peptidoglycan-binding protein [Phaeovulum sp. NW3]|uniref:peptidoglycan-binding protein n=1 Tax=Phaeovulum sp. NW3 TaxID=2934933 RepID=UPI002020945A|nr:peptidoglycan-binding protein [Phaeovulum sp. NW3]MCL7464183.1 peptidoglycan-binding protein [Phaeovulum sp. NW3]